MTCAEAMLPSVMEMRLRRSVVLMSRDLPTITRRGDDPGPCWDSGGRVGGWVLVEVLPGSCWDGVSACCMSSEDAEGEKAIVTSRAPTNDARTLIFRFLSLLRKRRKPCRVWKTESTSLNSCRNSPPSI